MEKTKENIIGSIVAAYGKLWVVIDADEKGKPTLGMSVNIDKISSIPSLETIFRLEYSLKTNIHHNVFIPSHDDLLTLHDNYKYIYTNLCKIHYPLKRLMECFRVIPREKDDTRPLPWLVSKTVVPRQGKIYDFDFGNGLIYSDIIDKEQEYNSYFRIIPFCHFQNKKEEKD